MRGGHVRLPIDTSRLKFLVVAPAEPLRQYEEGKPREAWAPRTDVNGEVLWRVQLVALGDGEAEIIRVAVPGDPVRRRPQRERGREGGGAVVMAIDDLLDRARDARRRRDEAASELAALVKALEGLDGVRMLDATQRRGARRPRGRPPAKTRSPASLTPGRGR